MQFFAADGTPLVGGKVYTYQAGTTSPQATYTDTTGVTSNTNPIILNSRGEAAIWLGGLNYKFKLTDANDVEIWTVDYISGPISGASPTLTGNVAIESDSSSPALKITQTGSGYALQVQDAADPDITPFVIDANGSVGIGTASPSSALEIAAPGVFTGAWAYLPTGTTMLFAQANAPTGWTKSTTHNNKALRVVSGAGGGSGGSVAFTSAFASQAVIGTVGGTSLTIAQMPAHTHTYTAGGSATIALSAGGVPVNQSSPASSNTGSTGSGDPHSHSFSGTAINLAVQYVDIIIAVKN
jgi:microcystin-dependent protein